VEAEHAYVESSDGTKLHLVIWSPAGAHSTVVLAHGLAEHMGRYEHIAAALTEAGFRVLGLEFRGHGDSEGKRGHVDDWAEYSQDLSAALEHAQEPCWILAHSMGGLVVLDWLQRSPPAPILGLVLTNPLLGVRVQAPAWKLTLANLLSKLVPRLSLSNELDTNNISRDRAVVEAYEADPLVYSTLTTRWYTEMISAMNRVHASAGGLRVDLLMVTSDADQICDPQAARELAARLPSPAAEQRYPELFHEVMNEPEKQQVLDALITWMKDRGSDTEA